MTYCIDRDQDQRLESYEAIEAIYLEGISDAADGRLPAMPDVIYLQGFCEGMRQLRMQVRLAPQPVATEIKEYPLLCGQCQYLNNGKCAIKATARSSTNYACDRVVIDSPF
ncbi:hypothetical protein [Chlorogloea sp. CCALA 695]|uniref:hypothetical protein n=1 Tax=Chlorogloea sp. CCALA 695 TaxID=2107693 RepID=UPI000D04A22C|nr:hypothetical protein [Chlorogloea sp. CCALA 695]PSB27933.1 hypothetical protein C7B70_21550 [Chlorogloea sp. CCALA 695]